MAICGRWMPGAAAGCGLGLAAAVCVGQANGPNLLKVRAEDGPGGWEAWGPRLVIPAGANAIVISGGPNDPARPATAGVSVVNGLTGDTRTIGSTRFWMSGGRRDDAESRRRAAFDGALWGQQLEPGSGAELRRLSLETAGWTGAHELVAGAIGGEPHSITPAEGWLCFVARDSSLRERVWRCDPAGGAVIPLSPHGSAWTLAPFEDGVLAMGYALDSSCTVLWRVPTASAMPETIFVMPGSFPAGLVVDEGGVAEFATSDGLNATNQTTLWRSDGTWAGTMGVATIPGRAVLIAAGGGDERPRFFRRATGAGGHELWSVRLDRGGLADRVAGPFDEIGTWARAEGRLVFTANLGRDPSTMSVWVSDGTPEGTRPLAGPSGAGLRAARVWTAWKEHVYLTASDAHSGGELWRTDGTEAGTVRLTDIASGPTSSWPHGASVSHHRLFFGAIDEAGSNDLWILDLCPADFDNDGQAGVADVFEFVRSYFAAHRRADYDGQNGVTLADLVGWLTAYGAGCE